MKIVPVCGVHLVIWILGATLSIHQEAALRKMCGQVRRATSCSTELSFITGNCNLSVITSSQKFKTTDTGPDPKKERFQESRNRTVLRPRNTSILKPTDETILKPKDEMALKSSNEVVLEQRNEKYPEPVNGTFSKPFGALTVLELNKRKESELRNLKRRNRTIQEPRKGKILKPRKGKVLKPRKGKVLRPGSETVLKGNNGTEAMDGTTVEFTNGRLMVTTSNRLSEADGLGKTTDRSVSNNTITSPQMTLFTDKMSWKQAERKCWQENGNLVTIDSQKKQTEVVLLANASGLKEIWIGLHLRAFRWHYSNDAEVNYSAWAPMEPSIFGVNGAVSRKFNYQWVVRSGSADGYICCRNNETRASNYGAK